MPNRNVLGQVSGQYIPQLAYPPDTAQVHFTQTPFSFGGSAFAPTLNTLYFTQVFIRSVCTVVSLHTRVIGSATVNSVFRLGLYDAKPNGQPNNLLVDAGTVDASSTGFKSIGGLSVSLTPGLYYAAFVVQGAGGPTTYNLAGWPTYQISTSVDTQQHAQRPYFAMTGQTGALPASWTGTNPETGSAAPHIVLGRS